MVGQERLLDLFVRRLVKSSTGMLLSQGEILRSRQRHLDHLDPKNILKRGYTITLKNGRVCTSVRELDRDDRISTLLADGEVESIVDAVYPDGSRK
jgi:exodeoxyribonuclease VII large subunit